jgi:hypothetical protein
MNLPSNNLLAENDGSYMRDKIMNHSSEKNKSESPLNEQVDDYYSTSSALSPLYKDENKQNSVFRLEDNLELQEQQQQNIDSFIENELEDTNRKHVFGKCLLLLTIINFEKHQIQEVGGFHSSLLLTHDLFRSFKIQGGGFSNTRLV